MSISNILVGKTMKENVRDIDWSVKEKPLDEDLTEIAIVIVPTEKEDDRVIVKDDHVVDRAIVNVDAVVNVQSSRKLRKFSAKNAHVIEEIVTEIVIGIVIVNEDDLEVTNVVNVVIVNVKEINAIVIVKGATVKIVVIVFQMRIQKKFGLKRNHLTIILIIVTIILQRHHTSHKLNMKMIMKLKRNTEFLKDVLINRLTIMILYKTIDDIN